MCAVGRSVLQSTSTYTPPWKDACSCLGRGKNLLWRTAARKAAAATGVGEIELVAEIATGGLGEFPTVAERVAEIATGELGEFPPVAFLPNTELLHEMNADDDGKLPRMLIDETGVAHQEPKRKTSRILERI